MMVAEPLPPLCETPSNSYHQKGERALNNQQCRLGGFACGQIIEGFSSHQHESIFIMVVAVIIISIL